MAELDSSLAETIVRKMHERSIDTPISEIAPLIHEDAEMRLLVSFGETVHGRQAILDALERGRQAAIYRARVLGFEWLDEHTLLSRGHARYALEHGGFAEGTVYWLDELRDGMIWRVRAFTRERDAREAWRLERDERAAVSG